ncbi:Transcriptional regulator ADR1 [Fusarium oxysporum f. sp. albedinis]|nr:Transcriptional regulator ADR1 [Fusarium oxysporum f. sp. albedinis]
MHTATASFIPSQYASQQETHFIARRNPHPPPSPPMEEQKCPLPSISNLLVLAEASSPTSESSPTSRQHSPRFEVLPPSHSRAGSEWAKSSHRGPPPTPPMSTDALFEGYSSPPRKPSSQTYPVGAYYPAAQAPPAAVQPPEMNPYYQRPPPQAYPPLVSMPAPAPSEANPWQYHHYLNPTGAAAFPQSQDQYIYPTCNKAFSRPSSLRIHSHSHTREKPFKCPHARYSKAFSVRSNLKHHERGCHSFELSRSVIRG